MIRPWEARVGHDFEQDSDIRLEPVDHAVVALLDAGTRGARSGEMKPEIALGDGAIASLPVDPDAADVGQKDSWFAGYVGAHVPRGSPGKECDVGAIIDVLAPGGLRELGWFDAV